MQPQPIAAPTRSMKQTQADQPEIFTQIYEADCNLAVWQRSVPQELNTYLDCLLHHPWPLNFKGITSLDDIEATLLNTLPEYQGRSALIADIYLLTDMFSCLFDLERVGLRLATLKDAMCPRFHVDHVPCRLVTTWCGPATQWLPVPLQEKDSTDSWNKLEVGDVALLKGSGWFENEHGGIVHRSPEVESGQMRLFMSLDFAN